MAKLKAIIVIIKVALSVGPVMAIQWLLVRFSPLVAEKFAHKYMRFPAASRRYIMAGFRYIYEHDEWWEPYATWSDRQFARDGLVIPPLNA